VRQPRYSCCPRGAPAVEELRLSMRRRLLSWVFPRRRRYRITRLYCITERSFPRGSTVAGVTGVRMLVEVQRQTEPCPSAHTTHRRGENTDPLSVQSYANPTTPHPCDPAHGPRGTAATAATPQHAIDRPRDPRGGLSPYSGWASARAFSPARPSPAREPAQDRRLTRNRCPGRRGSWRRGSRPCHTP